MEKAAAWKTWWKKGYGIDYYFKIVPIIGTRVPIIGTQYPVPRQAKDPKAPGRDEALG